MDKEKVYLSLTDIHLVVHTAQYLFVQVELDLDSVIVSKRRGIFLILRHTQN